jgi:glucose-6-phosphate isomerase
VIVSVSVAGDGLVHDQISALIALREDRIDERLLAGDATLWGSDAEEEASKRLGWLTAPEASWAFIPELLALRDALQAEGITRVVLCGMGGSSLAPEVICKNAGVPLVVLDSTHPDQVRAVVEQDLASTVVVVASKSGGTLETDSQRRAFVAAFTAAGIDAASRIIVVTDPGSPFAQLAADEGYRAVFLADPYVGGRYSALTAFGLVPSALAGADVELLLDQAASLKPRLHGDDNPGLELGAALGADRRNKIVIVGDTLPGFGDWAEQLIAESTGKHGSGLLPVVAEDGAPETQSPASDVHVISIGGQAPPLGTLVEGNLGQQLLLWEYATAISGRLLGINPFDQPDVESAKIAARGLLDAQPEPATPAFVDGPVQVFATDGLLRGESTVLGAVQALLAAVPDDGYLAVMAYLDRLRDSQVADVRAPLARKLNRPVTFGWGPRFLHSTGQFHKGGPPIGAFLQITGLVRHDVPIPDRPFTFGSLIAAQAAGDAQVLADHGRPVLRLHVQDPVGLAKVLQVLL